MKITLLTYVIVLLTVSCGKRSDNKYEFNHIRLGSLLQERVDLLEGSENLPKIELSKKLQNNSTKLNKKIFKTDSIGNELSPMYKEILDYLKPRYKNIGNAQATVKNL